jgi:hypothetical protein
MGAVRNCYIARERREFYVAEVSLKKILEALIGENFIAHLGMNDEQLERLRSTTCDVDGFDQMLFAQINRLIEWNQQIRRAISAGFEELQ